jgi:S-adenosylmethionine:tRNA ribosyltransferase-isomerase
MVLHRSSGSVEHRRFYDITDYLVAGDVLVFNDTRVIPARLWGRRQTGGKVELLLLRHCGDGIWESLVKPGRVRVGELIELVGLEETLKAEIGQRVEAGSRLVRFSDPELVEKAGEVPLPPYVHEPLSNVERYQTVYARVKGSAAAPTAGLHFTPDLLAELDGKGIQSAFVTLHIGLDTFRPVQEDDPREHHIHSEYGELGKESASLVNRAKAEGRRIVCVGTTSVRLVEAVAGANEGKLRSFLGRVDLFILPGFRFLTTDVMLTNFHLPRTTLLMLSFAFAGRDFLLRAYQEAIDHRYRFYSFGDAMLIL